MPRENAFDVAWDPFPVGAHRARIAMVHTFVAWIEPVVLCSFEEVRVAIRVTNFRNGSRLKKQQETAH